MKLGLSNNIDGREAIFDANGNVLNYGINRGTYNYGAPSVNPASNHSRYDMEPFFRQYQKFPWYRAYIPNFKDYNKNGGNEEIPWKF